MISYENVRHKDGLVFHEEATLDQALDLAA